jgi:hypothetical protein
MHNEIVLNQPLTLGGSNDVWRLSRKYRKGRGHGYCMVVLAVESPLLHILFTAEQLKTFRCFMPDLPVQ